MKNIVIIAHDVKKPEMVQFLNDRRDWIFGVNLIATGRTAEYVESQGIKDIIVRVNPEAIWRLLIE